MFGSIRREMPMDLVAYRVHLASLYIFMFPALCFTIPLPATLLSLTLRFFLSPYTDTLARPFIDHLDSRKSHSSHVSGRWEWTMWMLAERRLVTPIKSSPYASSVVPISFPEILSPHLR